MVKPIWTRPAPRRSAVAKLLDGTRRAGPLAGPDPTARVVVAGAGLAGLVTAERLSALGRRVLILEASPKAGGRCRSYHDERLGRVIDNGNHLILSAKYPCSGLGQSGSAGPRRCPSERRWFPFLDLETAAGSRCRRAAGLWAGCAGRRVLRVCRLPA